MLVLSRKPGESFFIGDDIEVLVVFVRGDKVRIGINAPKGVSVLREELIDKEEKPTKSEKK
jgi:carbon storage regulator